MDKTLESLEKNRLMVEKKLRQTLPSSLTTDLTIGLREMRSLPEVVVRGEATAEIETALIVETNQTRDVPEALPTPDSPTE